MLKLLMHAKDKYHGAHCVIAAFDGCSGDIQLKYSFKFCLFLIDIIAIEPFTLPWETLT